MADKKYNMSFSGLFYPESLMALDVYHQEADWPITRKKILADNLIQARTQSSAFRRAREVCFRLAELTEAQLQLLSKGSAQEQLYLLWVAVCKHHLFIRDFIRDFAINVLREKFLRMDLLLDLADYEIFFQEMADWHDDLANLADSTKVKLKQVMFKIMREADLLSKDNMMSVSKIFDGKADVFDQDKLWNGHFPHHLT